MIDLINDILFGAVLQPVLDLVGNPDMTANVLIALAFHPSPSRKFPPGCGQEVEILEKFVNDHRLTQTSVSISLLQIIIFCCWSNILLIFILNRLCILTCPPS